MFKQFTLFFLLALCFAISACSSSSTSTSSPEPDASVVSLPITTTSTPVSTFPLKDTVPGTISSITPPAPPSTSFSGSTVTVPTTINRPSASITKTTTKPVTKNDNFTLQIEEIEIGSIPQLFPKPINILTIDNRQAVFILRNVENKESVVWCNGRTGRPYRYIEDLQYSPNGQHIAYNAFDGENWNIVVDEKVEKIHGGFVQDVWFTGNGSQIAYSFCDGEMWYVVTNDQKGPRLSAEELPKVDFSTRRSTGIKQDSRIDVNSGAEGGSIMVIVNNKITQHIGISPIIFTSPTTFTFLSYKTSTDVLILSTVQITVIFGENSR